MVPRPQPLPGAQVSVMRPRPCAALVIALLIAAACFGQTEKRHILGGEYVRVHYWPERGDLAKLALREGDDAVRRLQKLLGVQSDERVDVFIVRSREEFDRLTGVENDPYVIGRAMTRRMRVVVMPMGPQRLPKLLGHELAHVVLDQRMGESWRNLPRWLHEGIAKYATNDFDDTDRRIVAQAAVAGELLTIDELNAAFGGDSEQVALAYAQSYLLVDYLATIRPREGIDPLLEQLEKDRDVRLALGLAYGRPVPEMQEQWLQRIQRGYAGFAAPPLSETIIGALFVVAFIIAIIAIRRRSARIRRRMEEEERLRRLLGEVPTGGFTMLPDDDQPTSDEGPPLVE